jgi:hydrogenase nickel incorporation protein HypA/HybF
MHELSVAQSIFDIVCQHVSRPELTLVRKVRVRVGTASGVVPDSLEFSFQAIIIDTPLSAARMEIESVPFRLQCENCHATATTDDGLRLCPQCGSVATTILSGRELHVKDIELADEEKVTR